MKKTTKPYLHLLKPLLAIAAVFLFILDSLHVNINSLLSYNYKEEC